jgi:hypothetical protein
VSSHSTAATATDQAKSGTRESRRPGVRRAMTVVARHTAATRIATTTRTMAARKRLTPVRLLPPGPPSMA